MEVWQIVLYGVVIVWALKTLVTLMVLEKYRVKQELVTQEEKRIKLENARIAAEKEKAKLAKRAQKAAQHVANSAT